MEVYPEGLVCKMMSIFFKFKRKWSYGTVPEF